MEIELAQKIYKLFIVKFEGNKSAFAKASQCNETTIRRILRNEQGITINLLIRLAFPLDVSVVELLKDMFLKKEN